MNQNDLFLIKSAEAIFLVVRRVERDYARISMGRCAVQCIQYGTADVVHNLGRHIFNKMSPDWCRRFVASSNLMKTYFRQCWSYSDATSDRSELSNGTGCIVAWLTLPKLCAFEVRVVTNQFDFIWFPREKWIPSSKYQRVQSAFRCVFLNRRFLQN